MASDLLIEISKQNEFTIIQFIGEARLDVEQVEFQLDRIIAQHPRQLIIDASRLSFCSSLGMRLFVNLHRAVRTNGGVVRIVGLQPLVKTSFSHACLLDRFELHESLQSALTPLPAAK